jgi:putative aldouronate transport system substrate-binding protein
MEAKQYLEIMRGLYEEGVLDREFAVNKRQNIKEKLVSGQAAMGVLAWWDAKVAYEALEENNPSGELEYIAPPVGPTGLWGMAKRGPLTFIRAIPRDADHPREVIQLMDFLATEEAQDVVGFGFEDEHYTRENQTIIPTPEAENIRWRIIYQWIDTPYSFNHRVRMKGYNPWFVPTEQWTVIDNWQLFAPAMETFDKNAAPLDDFVEESYIKFIMGERPLDEFEEFAEEYLQRGGLASMGAINEWYEEFK